MVWVIREDNTIENDPRKAARLFLPLCGRLLYRLPGCLPGCGLIIAIAMELCGVQATCCRTAIGKGHAGMVLPFEAIEKFHKFHLHVRLTDEPATEYRHGASLIRVRISRGSRVELQRSHSIHPW